MAGAEGLPGRRNTESLPWSPRPPSLQALVLGEQVVENPQGGLEVQVHHICRVKQSARRRGPEGSWEPWSRRLGVPLKVGHVVPAAGHLRDDRSLRSPASLGHLLWWQGDRSSWESGTWFLSSHTLWPQRSDSKGRGSRVASRPRMGLEWWLVSLLGWARGGYGSHPPPDFLLSLQGRESPSGVPDQEHLGSVAAH